MDRLLTKRTHQQLPAINSTFIKYALCLLSLAQSMLTFIRTLTAGPVSIFLDIETSAGFSFKVSLSSYFINLFYYFLSLCISFTPQYVQPLCFMNLNLNIVL